MSMYITDVKNGGCADTCHLGVGEIMRKTGHVPVAG
jgi:hypothetical protein